MARSATLNPASMPFFPGGGMRISDEDLNGDLGPSLATPGPRIEHDRNASALSTSPSDYRSVRSSPSPHQHDTDARHLSLPTTEELRHSPTFRQGDVGRHYPPIEMRVPRETSSIGTVENYLGGQDTPMQPGTEAKANSPFFQVQHHSRLSTPPVSINGPNTSMRNNGALVSSSTSSSLESNGQFSNPFEQAPQQQTSQQSFEAQLRASPFILGLVERIGNCEALARDIHRDLGEVTRKVNILVEYALDTSNNNNTHNNNINYQSNGQPEFKDPFAGPRMPSSTFPPPSLNPRPSIGGNIAPHQIPPTNEMSAISQRLNTLTSSVEQLLVIQTQQLQGGPSTLAPHRSTIASASPRDGLPQQGLSPNNVLPNQPGAGLGVPTRPEQIRNHNSRAPNTPMRTWSTGAIDPTLRVDNSNQRPDSRLMDKRRSVSGHGLLRRESVGIIDPNAPDNGAGAGRESGPMISKWEQLPLAPELQRSLSKFGVGPPNKIQQRALPFLLRGSDIIAQAPPTQERIAAYVIPAIQTAVVNLSAQNRGPIVVIVSTTVDQATQAQRMIRDLGSPIGIQSALGVGGTSSANELAQEIRKLQQSIPHIICGTPQKLHSLFTTPGGLSGAEVRFLVLDEVDQLIARNLHDFVFNIVKLLPPPRSRPSSSSTPVVGGGIGSMPPPSSFPLESNNGIQSQGRRFSNMSLTSSLSDSSSNSGTVERQTALFSNTVPQDVLNLATAIQLREPIRVLVRRDGNTTQTDNAQSSRGLRQFYLYLAFTAGGRSDPMASAPGGGLGIIGSGRGAASTAESAQAREWKLDALADLFEDIEISQAIVHVGGMTALDSVVFKLASRGLDAVPLHGDMNQATKQAALNKFKNGNTLVMRPGAIRVLVVYDVQVKTPDVSHVPLVINYDLPKAVEEYAHRVALAIASGYARPGVVINFVTATGGDVEMLRSIECFYKIKCPEVPMSLRDIV